MRAPCRRWVAGLTTLLAAALIAGALPAWAAEPPYSAALVIGNAHYTSIPSLKNPAHDAEDMCAALGSLGFHTTCRVDVDTRARLRSVIEDFVDSLPPEGAVSIIYYAGHGVQVRGENYLIPTAAQLTDEASVARSAVSFGFLTRQLRRTHGLLTVIILDACRNNPLPAGGELPAGLAQVTDIPDATSVLYATAANEPAVDGPGRNGILTGQLLKHLQDPGTIVDLFQTVSQEVQKETQLLGRVQKPALYTNFTGTYCLVRCTDVETLRQQSLEDRRRIAAAQADLAAAQARAREEALRRQEEAAKAAAAARKARQMQNNAFVAPVF